MQQCPNCKKTLSLQELYQYKDFLISEKEVCLNCRKEFEKNIDFFEKSINEESNIWTDDSSNGERIEEISAQRAIQIVMPNYEIIQMDTGSKDNQYDLLARKDDHSIAIEVTQAVNANGMSVSRYLEKHKGKFEIESRLHWSIITNPSVDLRKNLKKIEEFLISIEQHINYIDKNEINFEKVKDDDELRLIFNKLIEMGVGFFSAKVDQENRVLLISGPMESSKPVLSDIFRVAYRESNKLDNTKKLKLATTNERHIFISLNSFDSGAELYLQFMQKNEYLTVPSTCGAYNLVDVVWLAILRKTSFRVAKLTNCRSGLLILEDVTNGGMRYKIN